MKKDKKIEKEGIIMRKEISIISALPKPPRALSRRAVIYCRSENLWEGRSTREITLPKDRLGWNAATSLNVGKTSWSKLSSSQGTLIPLKVSVSPQRKNLPSMDCKYRPSCSPSSGLSNTSRSKSIHSDNISQTNSFAVNSPNFSDFSRNTQKCAQERNCAAASITAPASDHEGVIMETNPKKNRIQTKLDKRLSEDCRSSLNFLPYDDPHATHSLVSRDPLHLTWRIMRSFSPHFLKLYDAKVRHQIVHEVVEMVKVRKDQVKVIHLFQEEDASLAFTVALDLSDLKDVGTARSCETQLLRMSWSRTAKYLEELQSTLTSGMLPEKKVKKSKCIGNTEGNNIASSHVNPSQMVGFHQDRAYTSHCSNTISEKTATGSEQPLRKASAFGDSPLQILTERKGKKNGKKRGTGESRKTPGFSPKESLSAVDSSWKTDERDLDISMPKLRSSFSLTVRHQSETSECRIRPNRILELGSKYPLMSSVLEDKKDKKDEGSKAVEGEKWSSFKGDVSCNPSHSPAINRFRSDISRSKSSPVYQDKTTAITAIANKKNNSDADKFCEQKDARRVRSEPPGKTDSMLKKSNGNAVPAPSLPSVIAHTKFSDLSKPSTTSTSEELPHPSATKITDGHKVSVVFSTETLDSGMQEQSPSASFSNIQGKSPRKRDSKEKNAKNVIELGCSPSSAFVCLVNSSSHSAFGESYSDCLIRETRNCNVCSRRSSIETYSSGESIFLRTSLCKMHETTEVEEEPESCEDRSIPQRLELSPLDDSHLVSSKSVQKCSFTRAVGEGVLIIELPQNIKRGRGDREGKMEERLKLFFEGSARTLTVRQVKHYVAEHIDVDPTTLVLYYRGRALSDEMEGSALQWKNESVITVVELDEGRKGKKKEIRKKKGVQRISGSRIGTYKTKEVQRKKSSTFEQKKQINTTKQRETNCADLNASSKKKYDQRSGNLPRRSVDPHTGVNSLSIHLATVHSQKEIWEDASPYPQQCNFNPYPHSRDSWQSPPDVEPPFSAPELQIPLQMSENYGLLTENCRREKFFEEDRDQLSEEETEPKHHAPCPFS